MEHGPFGRLNNMALKKSQQSLKKWTEQKWQYSSKDEEDKPVEKRGRYLPKSAWSSLSAGEKRATNAAKRKGSSQGKQFVKQPSKIAKKVRAHRK
jgi:hypothetical protein